MAGHCCQSKFTGVHGWSVETEEQMQDGQKAKVQVVRCKFCGARADEEESEKQLELMRLNWKSSRVAANIRRDSDAFKQMSKRKAG